MSNLQKFFKYAVGVFFLIIIVDIIARISNDWTHNTIECKVTQKVVQQLIKEKNTEIRYLIITDKGTFSCQTSVLNGKFNNSDIFWRIKEDSTYTFKVAGIGKGMFFDYPNIIEIVK